MQVLHLNLEAKLFWQIRSLDQEIALFEIVNASIFLIIQRQLMQLTSLIFQVVLLALEVYASVLSLLKSKTWDFLYLWDHLPIAIHCFESTFHQFASFQQVVDVIGKHSLAVDVALDLEHELSTGHAICDL